MLLFFLMALVAAYTSRNLIFEQRTSTNQYRASQAFEAAEAGLNWALAQLNGGRINDACEDSADLGDTTFRGRYLETISDSGEITIRSQPPAVPGGAAPALLPACVFDPDSTRWLCSCPSNGNPTLPAVASPLAKPMFRIRLEPLPGGRRDVIRIVSAGCTRPDASCLAENPTAPGGDALAVLTALVTLRSGLSTLPAAAVTARQTVDAGTGTLNVTNLDPGTAGLTVLAGGAVNGALGLNLLPTTVPGTPGEESIGATDDRLAGYASGARMFSALFGMTPDLHRDQPGAVRLPCGGGCSAATVNTALSEHPGKVVWVQGDLVVDSDIGAAPTPGGLAAAELAASRPALIVVEGTATLSAGTVWGAIYSRAANWDRGTGNTRIEGALVAEGSFGGNGSQVVVYNPEVLRELRARSGSFVRVPGGWRDF
jgi:hypothetical protein